MGTSTTTLTNIDRSCRPSDVSASVMLCATVYAVTVLMSHQNPATISVSAAGNSRLSTPSKMMLSVPVSITAHTVAGELAEPPATDFAGSLRQVLHTSFPIQLLSQGMAAGLL